MLANISNLIYSPFEQFDSVSWVFGEKVYESIKGYSFYVFSGEYTLFVDAIDAYKNNFSAFGSILFLAVVFAGLKYTYNYFNIQFDPLFNASTYFFLVGFMHLLTGSFVFVWFDDIVLFTQNWNEFSHSNISFYEQSETYAYPDIMYSATLTFQPQIDFGIFFNENMISFLAAFFLLGGAEEEEDEDFLLEEEESDIVEDVVAPLFVANLGKDVDDNGALFLKVCSVFGFVLTNNLMGMLPYSDTATSSLMLTFWTGLSVFGSLIFLMIRKQGVNHLFSLFLPSGSPLSLMLLIIPLEFISYVFRVVSLSVRLFANMMAGHTLLKVILGFSWSMILIGDIFLVVNIFPIAILFVLTFLEIGVAVVQAYIFTTLICVYLKDIFVGH